MAKAKKTNRQPTPSKIKLTIKVDKEIRRKLRILAAEKDISISAFIEEIFNEIPHKAEATKRRGSSSSL
jgi:predicted HicB family RNase H-like nuclease